MLFYLLSTALLSYLFISLIIHFAVPLRLTDIPNARSTHFDTVPLGAGIGFFFAMMTGLGFYDINLLINHWYIFVGIFLVLVIGMIDDIKGTSPKAKILVIMGTVLLLWQYDVAIDTLGSYFGHTISLGWLSLPVTLIALVGFTNAFNLIDGIDGLAGMVSLLIIASFGYIGYRQADELIVGLSFFTIASIIPFIILNYNPAKIFMGDSGSLVLGVTISILAILSLQYIHPIAALYFTALPIYDTFTVIIRRVRKGVSIFKPDQTHIHHLLMKYIGDRDASGKRTGTRRTVWILVTMQFFFMLLGLQVNHFIAVGYPIGLLALVVFILGFIFIYKIAIKIENLENKVIL